MTKGPWANALGTVAGGATSYLTSPAGQEWWQGVKDRMGAARIMKNPLVQGVDMDAFAPQPNTGVLG